MNDDTLIVTETEGDTFDLQLSVSVTISVSSFIML